MCAQVPVSQLFITPWPPELTVMTG